jgi:hypothetical protein
LARDARRPRAPKTAPTGGNPPLYALPLVAFLGIVMRHRSPSDLGHRMKHLWARWRRPSGSRLDRFRRSAGALSAVHADRTVLLDLGSEEYFALDEVGARIWELLERAPTLDEVAHDLADRYDAPVAEIRADAEAFLDGLRRQGLVRVA